MFNENIKSYTLTEYNKTLISNLVQRTRFWNNPHQVCSKSKDLKFCITILEASKLNGPNKIAKFNFVYLNVHATFDVKKTLITLVPLYVLLELHISFKVYITIICGTLRILCLRAWLDDV